MRAFILFLFLLIVFLFLPISGQSQSSLNLSTNPVEVSGLDSVTLQIPADLDTFQYTDITFFLEGGDGGKADRSGTTGRSGDGAQVSVKFPIGKGVNALRPGGLVRFVVGSRGQNAGGGSTAGGAGGGGGTAILYKDPAVNHSGGSVPTLNLSNSINYGWTLLAVAGGGGGGYVDANGKSDGRPGQSGTDGSDGRSTGGSSNAGGSNGAAGVDQSNDGSGAGCGYKTTNGAGNNGYNGKAGGITGKKGDDFANRSGGFGYGPGGHGRSGKGGGGGGGYSGGGSGRNAGSAGGGGGSFANNASTATTLTERDDNNSPDDGFITYFFTEDLTPGPAPDASCIGALTVVVNDGGEVVVSGEDLNDGSTNPIAGNLSYLLCLEFGGEFFCFDDRTFDCSDVGENQEWFLGVFNSADTSICATPTIITIEAGTAVLPVCPNDREVNLNTGCVGTIPLQQLRAVSTGDCLGLDISLTLPNTQVVNNPTNFFEGTYEFIAGVTIITYTNSVGSCSFNVTLNAGSIPSLNCPSDRDRDARINECGRTLNDVLTDLSNDEAGVTHRLTNEAIGFVPITGTGNLGDFYFPRGITTVEYFKEDAGGCVSSCSFTITMDGDPEDRPEVTCADEVVVEYSPDLDITAFLSQGLLSVTDDCGIKEISYEGLPNIDCNRIGNSQDVQVNVLDIDGNAPESCSFNLILTETTPPVARCREPFTVLIPAAGGRVFVRPSDVDDGTTADCDFDLFMEGSDNGNLRFNCNSLGENEVTMIVTNEEGNEASSSCSTTVTVADNRPPTAMCQNTILILSETGEAFLAPTNLDGGSTDNCTITDFAASKTSFNCDDLGNNSVQLTLTDQSGNSSSCTSTVTIQDSPNSFCEVLLPVELTAFTGEVKDKKNQLDWAVANEEAFSHYEVERSKDGSTEWQVLGAIDGRAGAVAGAEGGLESNVAYTYSDAIPLLRAFYRLRMVDLDGSFGFSPLVYLEREDKRKLTVYPNPTTGRFTAQLPTAPEETANISVLDFSGKVLSREKTTSTTYEQHLNKLAPGVYLFVVEAASGRWTQRLVIH